MQQPCGQRHDSTQAKALLKDYLRNGNTVIRGAGYDSNELRGFVENSEVHPVIAYKERHKVENLFQKIKRFRRISTRYEKLYHTFAAMVTISFVLVWIRS